MKDFTVLGNASEYGPPGEIVAFIHFLQHGLFFVVTQGLLQKSLYVFGKAVLRIARALVIVMRPDAVLALYGDTAAPSIVTMATIHT